MSACPIEVGVEVSLRMEQREKEKHVLIRSWGCGLRAEDVCQSARHKYDDTRLCHITLYPPTIYFAASKIEDLEEGVGRRLSASQQGAELNGAAIAGVCVVAKMLWSASLFFEKKKKR